MELPAQRELDPAWTDIRTELRRAVGETLFDIWLAPLEAKDWDDGVLLLAAPAATRDWVAKRYGQILERSARTVVGSEVKITFVAAPPSASVRTGSRTQTPAAVAAPERLDRDQRLNPRLNFNQFVIGDGNRMAHAAALSVAEGPSTAYNPLFLHAPPGLGKTHLLHAIGNYVVAFGGGTTVCYTTVEAFTNHFISSLNSRSTAEFKHRYRDVDVLLIDDVQFLASKAKTEEEFFHTFNALYTTGRQLVVTCDRVPRQLVGLEDRLRERFESGLVAYLDPPDFSTRLAILRKRVALDRIPVGDPAVLELIAERIPDNIRALEGALIRVVAHHSLRGVPISLELAGTVLDEIHPVTEPPGLSIGRIQGTVASFYGITTDDLVSKSRTARISWPRQIAIQLVRELTDSSLQEIGNAFGGRNHATVVHACKKVSERVRTSPEAGHDLEQLHSLLAHSRTDLHS